MRWIPSAVLPLTAVAALSAPQYAAAAVYMNVEQAQKLMFPNARLVQTPVLLTSMQRDALRERSGVREPFRGDRIWKVPGGGFFVVDQVIGKHENIVYAVGLDAAGTVLHVEILEYNESYGYEVRDASWRRQFEGKSAAKPPVFNDDIKNISGATLSCKHVTQGVQRVLALYDVALKNIT